MKDFILSLQFFFKPSYWIMNQPYSKDMDEIMQKLLDKYEFKDITQHTAYLGEYEIWIENRPYACMLIRGYLDKCRPSRLTIKRGLDKLDKEKKTWENELKSINKSLN